MLCFKDKTFCSSDVDEHTCGREMTEKEKRQARKQELPVSYANFCDE